MEKQERGLKPAVLLTGKNKPRLTAALFLAVLSQLCSIIPYYIIFLTLEMIMAREIKPEIIGVFALIVFLAAAAKIFLTNWARILSHTAAYKSLQDIRLNVLNKLSKFHSGFFDTHSQGYLKTAVFDDIERLEHIIAHSLIEITQAVIPPLVLLSGLIYLNPFMGFLLLIPILLGIGIPMLIMGKYPEMMEEFTIKYRDVNKSASEFITTMPVIKMYQLTADKFQTHSQALKSYIQCFKKVSSLACKMLSISVVVLDSSIAFSIPIGGFLFFKGCIDSHVYLLMLLLSIAFYSSFASVMNIMMGMKEMDIGLESIRKIELTNPVVYGNLDIDIKKRIDIEYKNLSFSYDQKNNAVSNLSFKIPNGTITAFVGRSGSGKTTAAQMLGRYYEADSGSILINDINLTELSNQSLRDLTSFVFQDAFIMNDTIAANISMNRNYTEDEIIKAAKSANIHDFIETLPKGYDTIIGNKDLKLSGGQKQRIAIARTILKNSPVVIFDEATSYTDIENEHKIQNALSELLTNKTAIMIAHRLHTIINVDQIFVFDKGRVVETGTHDQLLKLGGYYTKLWNTYISSKKSAMEMEAI